MEVLKKNKREIITFEGVGNKFTICAYDEDDKKFKYYHGTKNRPIANFPLPNNTTGTIKFDNSDTEYDWIVENSITYLIPPNDVKVVGFKVE